MESRNSQSLEREQMRYLKLRTEHVVRFQVSVDVVEAVFVRLKGRF